MTLEQCLQYVDDLKPNAFSAVDKTRWLSALEARIRQEVWLAEPLEPLEYEEDRDRQLSLPSPHDEIYALWLMAQIDFSNGEYSKYQNTCAMFNWAYSAYVRLFCQTYDPAGENAGSVLLAELDGSAEGSYTVAALQPGDLLTGFALQILSPFGEDCSISVGDGTDGDRFITADEIDADSCGWEKKQVFCLPRRKTDITVTVQDASLPGGRVRLWGRVLKPLKGVS